MKPILILIASLLLIRNIEPVFAEEAETLSFAEAIAGLEHRAGLVELYLDHEKGRLLMALPAPDPETGLLARLIHATALGGGLGSNPVGLDRGSWSGTDILAFRLAGGRLVVEAENWSYRASADSPAERRAVRDSFARSVLWTAPPLAREEETGRLLVDATGLFLRDWPDIAGRLDGAGQGSFSLDADRSFLELGETLAFPDNVEIDATLTFAGAKPGEEVRGVTPDPRAVSLVLHHSLVRLPEDGYAVREADPRAGVIALDHLDYSAPLAGEIDRRLARRFRLEKRDPAAERSPARAPIVFYVDPGAPEPVRSALVEGASWWAEAFEAAGFEGGFRVEILPPGAHPLDIRYNVIQWVHRRTRGWSFGGGIADPRTGEMLKGLVVLGSQRLRQDRLIFEGLAADDPVELALARVRQLAAHEVGHALGFQHNMAASTYGGRASVMDYPAPDIRLREDGTLDFSNAYGVGTGAWDRFAVRWLYGQFDGADERAALDALVEEAQRAGLLYVADRHARPAGAAHPLGNLWDTGREPVAALEQALAVRRIALDRLGPESLAPGTETARLQALLVPVYLYHRYQAEAAAKVIGGMLFQYGRTGDATGPVEIADADWQRRALDALLATLEPAALDLPDALLDSLMPFGDGPGRAELFERRGFPAFDLAAAAETAAGIVLDALLHPRRMTRTAGFHRRDTANPGVDEILVAVSDRLFDAPRREPARRRALRHVVQERFVETLIDLGLAEEASPAVKASVDARLAALARDLDRGDAHGARLAGLIARYLERPAESVPPREPDPATPPGPPIGAGAHDEDLCWLCRQEVR